jgi:hypothetical protein
LPNPFSIVLRNFFRVGSSGIIKSALWFEVKWSATFFKADFVRGCRPKSCMGSVVASFI